MNLVALTLTLTLTLSGGHIDQAYLDVNPVVSITADYGHLLGGILPSSFASGFTGTTVGNIVFVNEPVFHAAVTRDPAYQARFWREEVEHSRQWSALGPLFPPLYMISQGEPFEPYPIRHKASYTGLSYDFAAMWQPTPSESDRCPALRIGIRNHGSALYPCWRF